MTCLRCGAEINTAATFCPECGATILYAEDKTVNAVSRKNDAGDFDKTEAFDKDRTEVANNNTEIANFDKTVASPAIQFSQNQLNSIPLASSETKKSLAPTITICILIILLTASVGAFIFKDNIISIFEKDSNSSITDGDNHSNKNNEDDAITNVTYSNHNQLQATLNQTNGNNISHTLTPETGKHTTELTIPEAIITSAQNALDPNNKPSTIVPSVHNPAFNNSGSNKPASNNGGSAKPTTPAAKPTAPVAKPTTPVVPGSTKPSYNDTQSGVNIKDLIDEDGVQVLGYKYSNEGNGYYYTDDKDCWQKNAGYNEVYDQMAPLTAMFIDQVRIRFNYGGKDWMVQLWKGQYGWLLVGAEIGLFTAEEGTNTGDVKDINHYKCANKEDWLYMSMDCYWAKSNNGHYEKVFSRPYAKYWWPNGYVKGQLTKYTWPRTELKTRNKITFKNEAMASAFVAELKKAGFTMAASSASSQLTDDSYYQSGADVTFFWSTIYYDCFK